MNDETRLVEQARRDPTAFATLYDRYVERIYGYALRQTGDRALAQDVTAATFEKALTHIRHYRWQGKQFVAWLYRIARNEAISQARRGRWLAPWPDQLAGDGSVERAAQDAEQHDDLLRALARLAPADRELIGLRFLEELGSDEVAELLGYSTANLYVRLHRALGRLRRILEQGRPAAEEATSHVSR
jgi:RNA polymerase sigma-70 factor (ECF subfamily)